MLSFPVPVLSFLFVSFRPSRFRSHSRSTGACLPLSPSAFPLLFRILSSASFPVLTTQPSVLPFPSSCPRLPVACPVLQFFLSAPPLSTFAPAWFPMLLFRFSVLGFLFVSFHPSRFRSHSRSTGASLLFRFLSSASVRAFRLPSAFFRPPQPASDYSAFRSFFSLLPDLPWQRFPRCFFPLLSGLFPCLPSDSGTQLSALPFACRCLASQWLPQHLGRLPFGFRPLPLGFRFRFWLLGSWNISFDLFRSFQFPDANSYIILHKFQIVNNYFLSFCTIILHIAILLLIFLLSLQSSHRTSRHQHPMLHFKNGSEVEVKVR